MTGARIGLDFDNTLAGYDRVFSVLARETGLAAATWSGSKAQVRDLARAQEGGERLWQEMQGQAYGRLMAQAEPLPGVREFLRRARAAGAALFVVSHKTEYGHFDAARVSLRAAALGWMEDQGFFSEFGMARTDIFFEDTRAAKLGRLAALGCTAAIDDLPEVLADPAFPRDTARYLIAPSGPLPAGPFTAFRSWAEITDELFPA